MSTTIDTSYTAEDLVLKDFTCQIRELIPPGPKTNDSTTDADQNG